MILPPLQYEREPHKLLYLTRNLCYIYLLAAAPGATRLGMTLTFLASADLALTTRAWQPQEMQKICWMKSLGRVYCS